MDDATGHATYGATGDAAQGAGHGATHGATYGASGLIDIPAVPQRGRLCRPSQKMNGESTSVTESPISATENAHATTLYTRPLTWSPITCGSLMILST